MRIRPAVFLWAVSIAVHLWALNPSWVSAGADDGEEVFKLNGSLRTIVALVDNYDYEPFFGRGNPTDEYSQTLLRLTAEGRFGERLSSQVHLVQSYTYFSGESGPGLGSFKANSGDVRYRALDESWDWLTDRRTSAALWLDRFNLKIALPKADITLGRQALTLGKAWFWNPLDVYLPFDPRQFDRDYKAGVDALRVDLPLGPFSGITLIGVLGRELDLSGSYLGGNEVWQASQAGSSWLARYFTNLSGWDLAVQGGKIYHGHQLGGGLVGEIAGWQVRVEAAYFWAADSPRLPAPFDGDFLEDHLTGVVGLGRYFPSSLDLELEYLFNGGGDDDLTKSLARYQGGGLIHLGRHLLGLTVSYDLLPILIGRAAWMQSLSDGSFQFQPTLTYSLSDNSELIAGAALNRGARPEGRPLSGPEIKSEFGTYPDYYFAEFKIYF